MANIETVCNIFGILGAVFFYDFKFVNLVLDVILYLTPIFEIITLVKTKKYENTSEFIFLLFVGTTGAYLVDFFIVNDWIAMSPTFIAIPANVIFYNIFTCYKYEKIYSKILIICFSWIMTSSYIVILYAFIPVFYIGNLAMILNISAACAILQKIVRICQNYEYYLISLEVTISNLISGICWTIFAAIKHYFELFLPSAIIVGISMFALCIYFVYKRLYFKKKNTENQQENQQGNQQESPQEIRPSNLELNEIKISN